MVLVIRGTLLRSETGRFIGFFGTVDNRDLIVIIDVLPPIFNVLFVITDVLIITVITIGVLIVIAGILISLVITLIAVVNVLVVVIDVLVIIVDITVVIADILVILDEIRTLCVFRSLVAVYTTPCPSFAELLMVILLAHQLVEIAPL